MRTSVLMIIGWLLSFTLSAQPFTLKSNDIQGQAQMKQVFNALGCRGSNIAPQLSWTNAPVGTQAYAITMYDPDAQSGKGWWHWVVFNIPSSANELVENAGNPDLKLAPKGSVQSLNSYGTYGYGGPCPPVGSGVHQYIITIYALKVSELDLNKDSKPEGVISAIKANSIQKATLQMYYKRDNK